MKIIRYMMFQFDFCQWFVFDIFSVQYIEFGYVFVGDIYLNDDVFIIFVVYLLGFVIQLGNEYRFIKVVVRVLDLMFFIFDV